MDKMETVGQPFAASAAGSPHSIAFPFGDQSLSYEGLDAASNRLARRLIAAGVGPETRVALAFERSLDMMVALLAVLKARAPMYPSIRDRPPIASGSSPRTAARGLCCRPAMLPSASG